MKFIYSFILFLFSMLTQAQLSKTEVTQNINQWYAQHPSGYSISINGDDAVTAITRYHPERPEEKNDIIKLTYKGMEIELKFDAPIAEISSQPESLQKHFSYVSLHQICHDISDKGWGVYPKTPQSVMREKGVVFSLENDALSIQINWSIYAVSGYRQTKKCNEELSIADGSVSEDCYVSVRKKIALEIAVFDLELQPNEN